LNDPDAGHQPGLFPDHRRHHRRWIHLQGPADECRRRAAALASADGLWVGGRPPSHHPRIPADKLATHLGSEVQTLVFDALEGFDANAFAIALGLVPGGGRLFLLTPPLERWPELPDAVQERLTPVQWQPRRPSPFLGRLGRLLTSGAPAPRASPGHAEAQGLTTDQRRALTAVADLLRGPAGRPLLLTADRGRGKSTVLGIAAARRLAQGPGRILVTAPSRRAVDQLFRQLPLGAGDGQEGIRFLPPDLLLAQAPQSDLLLVDEAAGIPLPLLQRLLDAHPRVVLATTVHGYEGSGRGFLLKLLPHLDRRHPGWRRLHLETPVRWAPNDPLEALGRRLLLLDAEIPPWEGPPPSPTQCRFERLDPVALAADEPLLRQLQGLLVSAHYRTTPRDLRYLLDAPNLRLAGLFHGERLVGALLAAQEGGLEAPLAEAVARGERRPRGHLLPQALAQRCELAEALTTPCLRVVRIAIHPQLQGRGLGSALLARLPELADPPAALLGSSFGATTSLVRFWQRAGYTAVRLGHRREASSGAHAVVMVRAGHPGAQALVERAAERFRAHFPAQLGEPFRHLEPPLALRLLAQGRPPPLSSPLAATALAYARGRLSYLDALGALRALAARVDDSEDDDQRLLVAKVLQGHPWAELVPLFAAPGKRALEKRLKGACLTLLNVEVDEDP